MDATGASPDCSIVGNTLERGFGHTPMGDHCGNACGLEVVLPTGEIIETGFSRFAGATTGAVGRWGVGPWLDGLFSQSSLGIVTRMSVWLMPAPEAFQAFFFSCRDASRLPDIIDSLRPLRMNGTLRSVSHIGNDYKVVSAAGQYPWAEMQQETPLGHEAMARVRKKLGIGTWNGSGGLYGTRAQVREARRQLRRALAGKVDRLQFVNDRLLALMGRFAAPFRLLTGWDIKRTLKVIAPVYNLLKGVPTSETMASTYWRKKAPPSAQPDPDRDQCGLLWCSPVVPNTGAHVAAVTALASTSYDRAVSGQDEQALRCYRRLTEQLLARGYPPYRLNVGSMEYLAPETEEYAAALRALKSTLDPRGILAPGRYEPPALATVESSAAAFLKATAG
jgi:4-cresol dehydrogenase (hydroxylating)